MAWRDLQHRGKQFLIAAVGAGLVFAMALLMTSLAGGFHSEVVHTVAATGADEFVMRSGQGGPFTGYAGLPESLTHTIAHEPGVRLAYPMLVSLQPLLDKHDRHINVHLIGYLSTGQGAPMPWKGRRAMRPGEIMVDSRAKVHIGDVLGVGGANDTVVGITHGLTYDAGLANAYVTLAEAQRVAYGGGHFITFVAVRGHAQRVPAGLEIVTAANARKDMLSKMSNAIGALTNVKYFLWIVAAVIIGIVTFLSALERLRDFAVLKAVGASSGQIYLGIAVQSVFVAVVASLLGVLVSRGLEPTLPLPLASSSSSAAALPVVAIVVGVIASVAGARQAVKVDPATAFGA